MISFRERNPITIGLVSLILILLALLLVFNLQVIPFIGDTYEIKAEFADAAGLGPENEVRVAGVKVGKVTGVELLQDRVLVTMEIEEDVDVPRGSQAEIALRTLLGTKFVTINARAEGEPLDDGGVIPLEQTKIPFEIYQATNAGVALLEEIDASELNEGFRALADVADDPRRDLARTLDGAAEVTEALASQSEALDSLLASGDELLATLDESSPQIQALIGNSNQVLQIISQRRAAVRSLLRNTELLAGSLGGLLRDNRAEIDSIIADLHATLIIVDSHLAELEEAVRLLGPSAESLGRILWRGRWAGICIFSIERVNGLPGPAGPVDCGT